jgi:carboxyl-terminal processing protease
MKLPPNARRIALTVIALVAVLIGGIWLGGHPNRLPGFVRNSLTASGPNRAIDEAVERIENYYYRPIGSGQLQEASIGGMVAGLHDRFSHYLSPSEFGTFIAPPHFTGIGVAVAASHQGLLIAHVFDSSPAQRAGLRPGETIVGVDGRSLAGLSTEHATSLIKGEPGTSVVLTLRHGGAGGPTRQVTVERAVIKEPVVASEVRTVKGHKIGIIEFASFTPGSAAEVHEALEKVRREGAEGIVLDLRSNGGGLVEESVRIASYFIPKGLIVSMRGRAVGEDREYATGAITDANQPMVVLVDENTASAAEILTGALQDHHRAVVIGTHTFGKGVFQEEQELSNGGALDITVGEYFTPNGRNLGGGGVKQGAGVIPEVKVDASKVDGEAGLQTALDHVAARLG